MYKPYYFFSLLVPLILSVSFLAIKQKTVAELCEVKTCPYCYGKNMCNEIARNKIQLQYNRISDFIYNIFSVKNVYFSIYDDKPVILKKLAHNSELQSFDKEIDDKIVNVKLLKRTLNYKLLTDNSFYVCNNETFNLFWETLNLSNIKNIFTILSINAEPILLQLFSKEQKFPVPKFYGSCGRLTIQGNSGKPLLNIEKFSWYQRAKVAYNLLEAAKIFMENHQDFRLYLTDISPDNIAIDENLDVSFIDLEHAILIKKTDNFTNEEIHYSWHDEEEYSFDPKAICNGKLSDHNLYSVCRLLLSKKSPWPMMEGGLLYNPPKNVAQREGKLFKLVEKCVHSEEQTSRFELAHRISKELQFILKHAEIRKLL